jgi:hypothetical protein
MALAAPIKHQSKFPALPQIKDAEIPDLEERWRMALLPKI